MTALLAAALAPLLAAAPADAAPSPARPIYTISIGQNEVPAGLRTPINEGLLALHYADDDAAAFHVFMRDLSHRAYLLSVLDADTQQRHPDLARAARVPSQADLTAVVNEVRAAMEKDRAAGREPVLVLFYSGHGLRDPGGAPGLALFDAALTQAWLYEELLARLPARLVHLIIDACHAEALVRPRDVEGRVEPLDERERWSYLQASTLGRFPHVGALLASTAGAQSFEWDAYRGGVFAHEVLSGLRGAADVNGDGQIEYSELAAFVAAANLRISDQRVRPQVVVHPPRADRRAALVDLTRAQRSFRLTGRAQGPWAKPFFVETEAGVRLLDSFPEGGARLVYHLPADRMLYLVGPDGEVALLPAAGAEISVDGLSPRAAGVRPRGAREASMRRGLFATAYGPSFYRGYVSRQGELVAVDLSEGAEGAPSASRWGSWDGRKVAGTALLAGGATAALAAAVFGGLTWEAWSRYEDAPFERQQTEARADYDRYGRATAVSGAAALLLGAAGAAVLYWPQKPVQAGPVIDAVAFTGAGVAAVGRF